MQADSSQQRAIDLICHAPFAVLTGGPGTGKSTCLLLALDRLERREERCALAAPTGKAAKRMSEATGGRPASTIHRLLGWTPDGWTHDRANPLPFDTVIIDEASMLDIELAESLVSALAFDTRLVLVGDANQLPSVGPGQILADLVSSEIVPTARLTTVHRAAAESWICRNAPLVLEGSDLELTETHDFRFFEADGADDVARLVCDVSVMPEFRGAQVLSPQRTTVCGVEALNARLQVQLNPRGADDLEWLIGERAFRKNDRVIQTVNDYTLGVFNGEVGDVVGLDDKTLLVDFGDRAVAYTRNTVLNLQLAYALTVHRCQGSEFPWVICVVHSAHSFMLTRQLFYTAITRAKKGVVIVGNRRGIAAATSAREPPKRNTALIARMKERQA